MWAYLKARAARHPKTIIRVIAYFIVVCLDRWINEVDFVNFPLLSALFKPNFPRGCYRCKRFSDGGTFGRLSGFGTIGRQCVRSGLTVYWSLAEFGANLVFPPFRSQRINFT